MAIKTSPTTNKKSPVSKPAIKEALQGEDYYKMVSEAAYYRAEKRDFAAGQEMEDWIAAETEIQELQKENNVA